MLRLAWAALSIQLTCTLLTAQDVIYRHGPTQAPPYLGTSMAGAGDVNGDGFADFLVGSTGGGSVPGSVVLYSGRNGRPLRTLPVFGPPAAFGSKVANLGDVDRDGVPDQGVTASDGFAPGEARVFSGRTGNVLYAFTAGAVPSLSVGDAGDTDNDGHADFILGDRQSVRVMSGRTGQQLLMITGTEPNFGFACAGLGDVDGDGHADFVLTAGPMYPANGIGHGEIRSGANGTLLHRLDCEAVPGGNPFFGMSVAALADVDGDGRTDVAIAGASGTGAVGSVRVYSGATGALLRVIRSTIVVAATQFGSSLAYVGDLDGDGRGDFAINERVGSEAAFARVVSGATGNLLLSLSPSNAPLGVTVAGPGDVNGDGVPDLVVASPGLFTLGATLTVHSLRPLSLRTDRHELPMSGNAVQDLTLAAGAQHAGRLYFVVGSATGTRPGLTIGSVHLPLNFDAYHELAAMNANRAPFTNTLGFLDAGGSATAAFGPVNLPELVGVTLDHAYWVIDLATLSLVFASNSAPVTFAP